MATLYELTGQVLELQELMTCGDIDEDLLNDTMESVMFEFEQKTDNYVKLIRNVEADVDVLSAEIERLKAKKDKLTTNIDTLKAKIKNAMEQTGVDKLKGVYGTISLRKSQKIPSNLTVADVPEQYVRVEEKKSIDKVSLTKAIKEGVVTNISLEKTTSLSIK